MQQEMKKSMVSDKKLINAVGGKSARACDNCIKKRARWYCAADDAFLCQSCDSSVHSANPLARRHERVRLKTSNNSINSFDDDDDDGGDDDGRTTAARLQVSVPSSWHHGFTKKARTPRRHKRHGRNLSSSNYNCNYNYNYNHNHIPPLHLVPEIGCEEYSHDENDEQLLYRVPIFDPFVAELCNSAASNQAAAAEAAEDGQTCFEIEPKTTSYQETNHLQGFLPSEMDLADFAADVESLLGKGLEDESFDMEGLGILDDDGGGSCSNPFRVKIEDDDEDEEIRQITDVGIDFGRESIELNFDNDSAIRFDEEGEDRKHEIITGAEDPIISFDSTKAPEGDNSGGLTFLSLNYDGVLSSWGDVKSPWTTGRRPELKSGEFLPTNLGINGGGAAAQYGEMGMMNGGAAAAAMVDGDREARVSRYREKRRTRLFAKKIRYEVRKLNAEKRPRMKGRFVKRTSLAAAAAAAAFPLYMNNNK
ncbi:zinc finger protein CONSTANS-LIKE 16-like [Andrographis paniculata]|uniref:zinc finger protein CONSTANS-LIKE 16-like n=1 Tax=Andrographis paniculata TaxID=175694 RepID=UPI0021E7D7E6|nr:zinc finger protein CONSTANS-LIKE 16-like [Andrographis paniculata]